MIWSLCESDLALGLAKYYHLRKTGDETHREAEKCMGTLGESKNRDST